VATPWVAGGRLVACGIALMLIAAASSCGGDETAARPDRPQLVIAPDPAATFAPFVHLHSDEQWWPIAADEFVDYATLSWANAPCFQDDKLAVGAPRKLLRRDQPMPVLDPQRLGHVPGYRHRPYRGNCAGRRSARYSTTQHTRPHDSGRTPGLKPAEGYYLDLLTAKLDGDLRIRHDRGGQALLADVPIYVERTPERTGGRRGLRMTYWLLFGLELPEPERAGDYVRHEGDWERVSVLLRRGKRRDRYVPVSVRYHQPGRVRDIPWRSVELAETAAPASHPVVYLARGSHTPYPSAGVRTIRTSVETRFEEKRLSLRDQAESCTKCPQWRTWRDLRELRAQPWYGYGGAWGYASADPVTSGPIGPSPFR